MFPTTFSHLPGFLDLGAWTVAHLKPIFQSFRGDDVAPALAFIIFAMALALCVLFLIDSTLIRGTIWRRIRTIRKVKTKADFAAAMPQIEKLIIDWRGLHQGLRQHCGVIITIRAIVFCGLRDEGRNHRHWHHRCARHSSARYRMPIVQRRTWVSLGMARNR
jgi:hypothetical protein